MDTDTINNTGASSTGGTWNRDNYNGELEADDEEKELQGVEMNKFSSRKKESKQDVLKAEG